MPSYRPMTLLIRCFCPWLAALLFAPALWAQAPKAWELREPAQWKQGDVQLILSPGSAGNDRWAFTAVASQRSKAGSKTYNHSALSAEYRGRCQAVMPVDVRVIDPRGLPGNPPDLSAAAIEAFVAPSVQALVGVLREQCEQLQLVRVKVLGAYEQAGRPRQLIQYDGTMDESTGWHLAEGARESPHDAEARLAFRILDNGLGVHHLGHCEAAPTLLIEPMFMNPTDRAARTMAPAPSLADFERLARAAAAQYRAMCPAIRQIQFATEPLPSGHVCGAGTECFVRLVLEAGAWRFDGSELTLAAPADARMPQTLLDVTEVMAAGRPDLVPADSMLQAFFAVSFLESFGNHCAEQVQNATVLEIQRIRTTRFANGAITSDTDGPPSRIRLDRALVEPFRRERAAALERMTLRALGGGNPVTTLNQVTAMSSDLDAAVQGHCRDERIQTAYENLSRQLRGQSPVTGRFTTNFSSARPDVPPQGSALAFTSSYRSARDQAQRSSSAAPTAQAAVSAAQSQGVLAAPSARRRAEGTAQDAGTDLSRLATVPGPQGRAGTQGTAGVDQAALIRTLAERYRQDMAALRADYQRRIGGIADPRERMAVGREFSEQQQTLARMHRERIQALGLR